MIEVSTISAEQHRAYVDRLAAAGGAASFLQTPGWAAVKPEWRAESLGWFSDGEQVGAALVLYRQLPRVRRYLAYLPEGPLLDWGAAAHDLPAWLDPLTTHVRQQGAFGIRLGPPVVTRRWSAAQVKEGIADETVTSLTSLSPTTSEPTGLRVVERLRALGWRPQSVAGGFAAG